MRNEIVLAGAAPLARRQARDGCWEVDRLDRPSMAALLAYACDLRGLDPDDCAEVIHDAAGLIGRDDNGVRAQLRRLPLRTAVSKEEIQLAYRLVRMGVPGSQLATGVRRAKLGLGEAPPFCDRLTLCGEGVVLGRGTVVAPLIERQGGRLGLEVEGRAEDILLLLSVARGGPAPIHVLDRLSSVSVALQRGDKVLAEIGLALVGQPTLPDRAAVALAKTAAALKTGVDPRILLKALGIAAPVDKASPDDPKHPGWPKGDPEGRGGQFRPKGDAPGVGHNNGPPMEEPESRPRVTGRVLAQAIKANIRQLIVAGITAALTDARIAALLAGVAPESYPYIIAYFDPPRSLDELQAAAQSRSKVGYEDHHIVEQATANPDGSEDGRMSASNNLARIPTAKHWQLNSWYETPNDQFDGLTPRGYLKGKSWEVRWRVGLDGLRFIGVLK